MGPDIICFSHLRWNFVYQRPQHLMTRLSVENRVFFVEEPLFDAADGYYYHIYKEPAANVHVIIPHLRPGLSQEEIRIQQRAILLTILEFQNITRYILWYYSPMSYSFSSQLDPLYVIYDCMDELSAFLFAPPALRQYEQEVLKIADLVFTGGNNLYQAKKHLHRNIHPFPSSIDKKHFLSARSATRDPADQRNISFPRFGFYGVLDERLDIALLDTIAERRPSWQFILVGPVVKIDPAILPKRVNIHYLGSKQYNELPQYLAGWDIAIMPFVLNECTRFISPTKTPEYLAGGKRVISPAIEDVVTPYGNKGLVAIANTPEQFIHEADILLQEGASDEWLEKVDDFLADLSWDRTVAQMKTLIHRGLAEKKQIPTEKTKTYV